MNAELTLVVERPRSRSMCCTPASTPPVSCWSTGVCVFVWAGPVDPGQQRDVQEESRESPALTVAETWGLPPDQLFFGMNACT